MRHRVVPVALSALLLVGAACSDDSNDAVATTAASAGPVGGQDTSAIAPASSAETGDGPTLGEVVAATLAEDGVRYTVQVGAQDAADDLMDQMLSGASDGGSTSSSDSTSSTSVASSESTTAPSAGGDTTTPGSDASSPPPTCDVDPMTEAVAGEADIAQQLRCVALPDGQLVMVQDRDIFLFADGSWSVVHVQFDNALAQMSPDALAALVDPVGVLHGLVGGAGTVDQGAGQVSTSALQAGGETTSGGSTGMSSGSTTGDSTGSSSTDTSGSGSGSGGTGAADLRGTEGPDGFEYRVMVSIADLDDPFLVALAQRAGAQTVQVHLVADQASGTVTAMTFDFPDAAATTGGATGSGTGGTSPTGSAGSGTTVNPQGGGSGSTVAATVSTLPQAEDSVGADSTLPEGAFDVPSIGLRLDSTGGVTGLQTPEDAADLTLGDLAAALSVDLPTIGG